MRWSVRGCAASFQRISCVYPDGRQASRWFLWIPPSAWRPGQINVQKHPGASPVYRVRLRELLEEADVVLEEGAQVVDAVAQHREALHAQPEGEAGVAFRVDADRLQHVRVDHAAAQHFQPAGAAVWLLPGDVHF